MSGTKTGVRAIAYAVVQVAGSTYREISHHATRGQAVAEMNRTSGMVAVLSPTGTLVAHNVRRSVG